MLDPTQGQLAARYLELGVAPAASRHVGHCIEPAPQAHVDEDSTALLYPSPGCRGLVHDVSLSKGLVVDAVAYGQSEPPPLQPLGGLRQGLLAHVGHGYPLDVNDVGHDDVVEQEEEKREGTDHHGCEKGEVAE